MNKLIKIINSSIFREVIYSGKVDMWWEVTANSIKLHHTSHNFQDDIEHDDAGYNELFKEFSEMFDRSHIEYDGETYTTIWFI